MEQVGVGKLYIVATPIGHRQDITSRAVEVLRSVDWVACEDTRHSRPLLQFHEITTDLMALHQHNESQRSATIIQYLREGKDVALISDAGTPLVSDPGARLVAQVIDAGLEVVPIPGACAAITALSASGLLSDEFVFIGFLPSKGARREQALLSILRESRTIILYESVHRLSTLLKQLSECLEPDRRVVVARELTKRYECFVRGSIDEVIEAFAEHPETLRGEFVVLIEKSPLNRDDIDQCEQERILALLLEEWTPKTASRLAAKITGGSKNALYRLAIEWNEKE
ncbi:MAG TPA: 16S rRNA (cytidine(1402)-2'-O)-methyltransferase [Coxiellaceae bacterium]|nr:16S rRNA (cytidine(1402)-2'-O)-methyltransferase [Coxiellaceae bacterium]